MQKKIINITILLCFLFSGDLLSQIFENLKFENYTSDDGLSNSHINCIIQDQQGFVWFGTEYGLNKFDGYKFTQYFNIPADSTSLPSSAIYSLHIDGDGVLWVGTFSGLCRYNASTNNFVRIPLLCDADADAYPPVKALIADKNNRLWIGTSGNGLIMYNQHKGKFVAYRDNCKNVDAALLNYVICLAFDSQNRLWVGTQYNGVYIMQNEDGNFLDLASINSGMDGKMGKSILCLTRDNDKMWVGTIGDGFYCANLRGEVVFSDYGLSGLVNHLNHPTVYSIFKAADDKIWLGTDGGGISVFDKNTSDYEVINSSGNRRNGLLGNSVRLIFEDKIGNKWFAVHQRGVNLLRKFRHNFRHIHQEVGKENSLSNNSVLCLEVDSKNNVWIGTDGGGINYLDTKTGNFKHFRKGNPTKVINSDVVRDVYIDHDNNVWFATYLDGVFKLKANDSTFLHYKHNPVDANSLGDNDITSICQDKFDRIWFATAGKGLSLFNEHTKTFTHFRHNSAAPDKSLVSDWIVTLYEDSRGYIWIGTYWGLSRFNPVNFTFRNYTVGNSALSDNTVFFITEDSQKHIWVGTRSGLNLLDEKTGECLVFTMKDGLPSNVINAIQQDDETSLWISTSNGVCRFNYVERTSFNYYAFDGLQNNEFIHGSSAKSKDGVMYFGGIQGVTAFNPSDIKFSHTQPEIFITGFQIFNKDVPIGELLDGRVILDKSISETENITLQSSEFSFSFEFTAVDFNAPKKILYACKMEGFDKDWNYFDYTRRFITYTNLDAGEYTFLIKASYADGQWGEEAHKVRIKILPSVWRTWMAYVVYCVVFVCIVYIAWMLYSERIHERNRLKIEKLSREKDNEMYQAKLQFFTNISHEFRTPLTLIIGPLESMLVEKKINSDSRKLLQMMLRNANRLLRLVNQLLDLRKVDTGKARLQAAEQDIVLFVRQICETFESLAAKSNIHLVLNTAVEKYFLWFDSDKMDKIIFNLLSNAFKFTESGGEIKVELQIKNIDDKEYCSIDVVDNGRGMTDEVASHVFERFYQGNNQGKNIIKGSGIGLSLTKNYVDLHRGVINVDSQKGVGTTFSLLLPTGNLHLSPNEIIIPDSDNENHQIALLAEIDREEMSFANQNLSLDSEKPLILIVEDNQDVRSYLKDRLSSKYQIAEAENGRVGLVVANELMPDLVITDVMMPEMDGHEFCKQLKSDINTSHIPVIMLTARTSIEHRIEGLETGADSFICKPFTPMHLEVRIRKLIELRHNLKLKFSTQPASDIKEIAVTTIDNSFLVAVTECINQHLAESEFGVEELSRLVGMSRGHLHRKLKSLTNQSPNEFIRIIRLKQAAQMLRDPELSISEVAYRVGFSAPSYFSTCFTKQFGISPSQFKEN